MDLLGDSREAESLRCIRHAELHPTDVTATLVLNKDKSEVRISSTLATMSLSEGLSRGHSVSPCRAGFESSSGVLLRHCDSMCAVQRKHEASDR